MAVKTMSMSVYRAALYRNSLRSDSVLSKFREPKTLGNRVKRPTRTKISIEKGVWLK